MYLQDIQVDPVRQQHGYKNLNDAINHAKNGYTGTFSNIAVTANTYKLVTTINVTTGSILLITKVNVNFGVSGAVESIRVCSGTSSSSILFETGGSSATLKLEKYENRRIDSGKLSIFIWLRDFDYTVSSVGYEIYILT